MKIFRRRFIFIVSVLLLSIALQPAAVSARKRCPVRIPDSLLTLYLKSDLIVVGSITGEKTLKMRSEYDYGSYFDIEKNLRVSKTLKGRDADSAAFVASEFKSKNAADDGEEIKSYAMNIGDVALFFLTKNAEDDSYELADSSSGMKRLDDAGLVVYAKRIEELKRITTTKKNQIERLAEWLVRLAEEPVTRVEGTIDLGESFDALEYAREEAEANAKKTADNAEPFVLDKDFRVANAPEIAEVLTDSQKSRLSNALLAAINEDLLKINGADDEEEIYPDYRFVRLVGHWDKTYAAMNSFALLQNTGDAIPRRAAYLMKVIADFLDDDELYSTASEYDSALGQTDDAMTDDVEEKAAETIEDSSENETNDDETENSATTENVQAVQVQLQPESTNNAVEEPAIKITVKELRAKLFARFGKQYGIAVSQILAQ